MHSKLISMKGQIGNIEKYAGTECKIEEIEINLKFDGRIVVRYWVKYYNITRGESMNMWLEEYKLFPEENTQ